MQKLFILLLAFSVFSCRKGCQDNTGFPLSETNWNLYFKNNGTFTFFAGSQLYFKANKEIENYRSADTVYGTWETHHNEITIQFENGDFYNGTAITSDSLSGTLTASGNNGTWYATKR